MTTTFEPHNDQDETVGEAVGFDQEDSGQTPDDAGEESAEVASESRADTKPASSRRSRGSKLTRKQVVSILRIREQVVSATDEVRSIVATLLGVADSADYDGVTVAVVTADRSAHRAVESLSAVAGIDEQLDRVVAISTWDRTTTSSAWKLLHELDLVSRQLPSNNAKAAAAIAKAADELPQALTAVADLLGR